MAGGAHVGVDPTVGTVRPPAHVGSAVDLDVVDDEVVGVEALVLGVGLRVLEEVEQELGGLLGPATLGGAVDLGLKRKEETSFKSSQKC